MIRVGLGLGLKLGSAKVEVLHITKKTSCAPEVLAVPAPHVAPVVTKNRHEHYMK